MSDRDAVLSLANRVKEEVGDVSILINNAGIMNCHPLLRHNPQEIRKTYDINVLAHFWVSFSGIYNTFHTRSQSFFIRLTPNDPYMGRTAPLTSKCFILYIYSTNIGTEYFKRALYSPFFSLHNAVCFIMLTCLVPVLFTFYAYTECAKIKKIIPAPKG